MVSQNSSETGGSLSNISLDSVFFKNATLIQECVVNQDETRNVDETAEGKGDPAAPKGCT